MTHELIVPDFMSRLVEGVGYAPAVRVGDVVHVSGQVGRDRDFVPVIGDLEAHIAQAFENLVAVLEAAGCGLEDVFELTTYHVGLAEQMPTFVAVKRRYFGDPATLPAWTAVGVAALNHPDFLIEIAAKAHRLAAGE